jgi:hypothetical protein
MKSTGENRQLGEKPVPVPICPPQISHGLDLGSNPGLRAERPATNRHGTAHWVCFFSYDHSTHFRLRFYVLFTPRLRNMDFIFVRSISPQGFSRVCTSYGNTECKARTPGTLNVLTKGMICF